MEQINDIRKRIRSVTDIQQMTRAMQLISAVKMRHARAQLEAVMPFFMRCAETMIEIEKSGARFDNRFFTLRQKEEGETWKIAYFIMMGDQGLAGAYNLNVINTAETYIRDKEKENVAKGLATETRLYVCGTIGKERLIRSGFNVDREFNYPIASPTYYRARDISDFVMDLFDSGKADLIYFIYTRITSAISMHPMITRVIPVNTEALQELVPPEALVADRAIEASESVEYYPDANEVLDFLMDTYLNGMVYGFLTEAFASEQTARMMAMDNATKTAKDMLDSLTLKSNQARQARITNELTEIVSGAD
ncbi:MAG: ATP synthase F1 subunit gamma, partial [Clostridia bacterium]|nr:ATP synthase F1 subunit gamma [Clostridia bacterium]